MQNNLIAILKCQTQKNIYLEEEIKICPEYIQNKHMCNTKNTEDVSMREHKNLNFSGHFK